ncbi:hypothetical protein PTT_13354 [Paecilomyces variotii No. 5]|uniref:Nephrocystin 3-like N-terminal domain-containing protein n=1 Tax=Byssochlamys spectabilis (strain No. 5 / NBRC 109023) TaxID=1356009 RepID=V5FZM4_BYSSN|nr:hypothetical protein PTT_13354 [Paecilomyces variotii No. 5]
MAETKDHHDGLPAQLHLEYIPSPTENTNSTIKYHGEAAVDIILVHGLSSKFQTTWAYKRTDGSRYHWVREKFPQDMPDARILTFEYPSRWYNDPVHTDLTECASELLRTVIRDRCHAGSPTMCRARRTRPIIFVGHSFGGLVIKKAMVMASQVLSSNASRTDYENHRDFLSAVSGVIFLGTPHRGSSFALLAGLKIGFGKRLLQVKSNEEIISILKPDSYTLDELQREFAQLCVDERMSDLMLVCYHEMREVVLLRRMVVSRDSAILDNSAARGMDANHMDMNTFYDGDNGRRDNNYDHFISDVRMVFHESQVSIPKRFGNWVYGSATPDPEREQLQRKLDPSREPQETTYFRRLEIQQSAEYTCHWTHEVSEFQGWRDGKTRNYRTLWINGPAGSGKSVLASYIINSLKHGSSEVKTSQTMCDVPISNPHCGVTGRAAPVLFFLCGVDRKSETPERMLATLIHQLLLALPESQELFNVAKEFCQKLVTGGASSLDFAETLKEMASKVETLYIVIDNLEDISIAGKFLERLAIVASCENVRCLISSQETMEISDVLSEKFHAVHEIPITDFSADDISKFIESKGKALFQKKPLLQAKEEVILQSLHARAQGMFQWVNSALEHLRYVEDPRDIEPQLDDIRGDLLDTYDKIFQRLGHGRDDRIEKRIMTSLKFIAISATPVTAADIKTAWLIQEFMDDEKAGDDELRILFEKAEGEYRAATAESDIRNYLSSIVDICSDGTLQFKHQSYLRALTRINSTKTSPDTVKFKFTLEEAHQTICQICMMACRDTTFIHANSFSEWRAPLVEYAWNFWAYHFHHSKLNFTTVEDVALNRLLLEANPVMRAEWDKINRFQGIFNRMVDGVSKDALLYVEALMDFLSRPLRAVPGRFSDREYVLSLQRAQESLLPPARDLCVLRQSLFEPISSKLQHMRRNTKAVSEMPVQKASLSSALHQAGDKVSGTRSRALGKDSTVRELCVDDYLQENPALPRPSGSPQLLLEIARNLRVVALRFSVDPIYSSLLATASGSSFSPLHPLVYLAHLLEESGLYPYWDSVPPTRDLMEPFICSNDDPEYAPAKFVLHCFEWRDPRQSENVTSPTTATGFYIRTTRGKSDVRPSPTNHGLVRVSTENWEQVRRLHQLKAENYHSARVVYNVFSSDNDYIRKFIINPSANLHMKYSLLVHEHEGQGLMYSDPNLVLAQYAPSEVRETPLESYLRSLPSVIRAYFVHYVISLVGVFGHVARRLMAYHFSKVEVAIMELRQVMAFFRTAYHPKDLSSRKCIYLTSALFLFYLRCRYFPSWGAFFWYHTWSKFSYAYKHPAAYIDLQKEFGFWSFCWNSLRYFFVTWVGNTAIIIAAMPIYADNIIGHVASTYSIFHCLCAIDRSLFSICAVIATLVACGIIMFSDEESIAEIFKFSLFWWLMIFINMIYTSVQLGYLARIGLYGVLGGTVLYIVLIILICIYASNISNFIFRMAKPLRVFAMWTFRRVLHASIFAVQLLGIALLLFMVYKAFWATHKFIWDPYDIEHSLKELLHVTHQVHRTLDAGGRKQYKRIGWYPLGERIQGQGDLVTASQTETGPSRVELPMQKSLQEVHSTVTEGTILVTERTKKYFESGEYQSHRNKVGEFVENIVLDSGDNVAGAAERARVELTTSARKLKLQIRDALDGPLKEE